MNPAPLTRFQGFIRKNAGIVITPPDMAKKSVNLRYVFFQNCFKSKSINTN